LAQLALAVFVLAFLFRSAWTEMADQWWNTSTYSHILLVPAILAWLLWQRRDALAGLVPEGWWPGLLVVGGGMFLGLLGSVSGLNIAQHLAAVIVLQGAILTLLGIRVSAALAFPLGYLLFMVPFGDRLVPFLQTITAKITIFLVNLSGVPAEIDGVFIDTPVGLFEVAEACSGVKFLIAMLALGTLVAHVCFRSWKRRTIFMIVAVILPVIANGIRAWGTIYIAQFAGLEFAAGFDHIVYGWVFFAVVMLLLLAGAWKFFDRAVEDSFVDASQVKSNAILSSLSLQQINARKALIALTAIALVFTVWGARATNLSASMPSQIALPNVEGWELVSYDPQVWWEPRATGAEHRLLGRYRSANGQEVDVFLALYSAQDEARDAGSYGEGALTPSSAWSWLEQGPSFNDGKAEILFANGDVKRLAVTWYRTGDLLSGSNARLKLATMRNRMMMRDEPTMMLILSAEQRNGNDPATAINSFRAATGSTGEWMDRIAKGV
jgi:exosortase A